MYRDFLEAFGIDLVGVGFERVVWLLGLVLGAWGAWGVIDLVRQKQWEAAALRGAVSAALLLFCGYSAWQAFFSDSYVRFFSEEIVINTYALAIVTGFLLAAWVAAREGKRVGIEPTLVLDMSFWALIFGMIGARLLFILVNHDVYIAACTDPAQLETLSPELYKQTGGQSDCLLVFKFWEGGLVFYGAFLGAASCVWFFARKHALKPLLLLDTTIPSLALGQAFGRLGCLGAGCCWGDRCTSDWGIRYSDDGHGLAMPVKDAIKRTVDGDPIAEGFLHPSGEMTGWVHPTQLYESCGELAIFLALLLWRPHKRIHGEILAMWMTLYGFWRTLTEMTRGDKVRGYATEIVVEPINELLRLPPGHVTFLTTSQIIGLCLGFGGMAFWIWLRRRANQGLAS